MEESIAYKTRIQPHLHDSRNMSVNKHGADTVRLFK